MSWRLCLTSIAMGFMAVTVALGSAVASDHSPAGRIAVIGQNFPDPFSSQAEIRYELPHAGQVTLKVYNIVGQEVRTLVRNYQPQGQHLVIWDGTDERGSAMANGVYFFRIQAGDFIQTRKVVLLR